MVKPYCKSKKHYQKHLREHIEELSSLQQLHYASNRYALMLVFQGMDAAGKDGAIRHVMSGVNPQGCEVFSFKHILNLSPLLRCAFGSLAADWNFRADGGALARRGFDAKFAADHFHPFS